MESKSTIYISGAITGNAHYKEQFKKAQEVLESTGFYEKVINPATIENAEMSYKQYLDMDLITLMTCTHIYMMEGWQHSKGACLEHNYAVACALKVIYG